MASPSEWTQVCCSTWTPVLPVVTLRCVTGSRTAVEGTVERRCSVLKESSSSFWLRPPTIRMRQLKSTMSVFEYILVSRSPTQTWYAVVGKVIKSIRSKLAVAAGRSQYCIEDGWHHLQTYL